MPLSYVPLQKALYHRNMTQRDLLECPHLLKRLPSPWRALRDFRSHKRFCSVFPSIRSCSRVLKAIMLSFPMSVPFVVFLSVVILPHPTTCFSTTGARRVSLRVGRRRGDFSMVRRGSRDSLHLGNASAEAKATRSVHLGKAAPAGPSKTSERATDRTEAVSLSN